jgi:hypothetical protein
MALDPDLIDHWWSWFSFWVAFVWHYPVPVVASYESLGHISMYRYLINQTVSSYRY